MWFFCEMLETMNYFIKYAGVVLNSKITAYFISFSAENSNITHCIDSMKSKTLGQVKNPLGNGDTRILL